MTAFGAYCLFLKMLSLTDRCDQHPSAISRYCSKVLTLLADPLVVFTDHDNFLLNLYGIYWSELQGHIFF